MFRCIQLGIVMVCEKCYNGGITREATCFRWKGVFHMIVFPAPTLDRQSAMKKWLDAKTEYAENPNEKTKWELERAADQMVANNTALITFMLKKLTLDPFDDDLFATGLVGLTKAMNVYDETKGTFSTFATRVIRNEILSLFKKKRVEEVSCLDSPVSSDDNQEICMIDSFADDCDVEGEVLERLNAEEEIETLKKTLTSREMTVYFLLCKEKLSYSEAGKKIGTSKQYVQQSWFNILKKAEKRCQIRQRQENRALQNLHRKAGACDERK